MRRSESFWKLLLGAALLSSGIMACSSTPTPIPTALPTLTIISLPPTGTPSPTITGTATPIPSPTTSPSPTLTVTPIAVGDRLPKEPGQHFRITVNEQDLQRMVLEEKSPEVEYQDVVIKIHSDGIVIETYAYLIMAQMRVHAEAKGTVAIENGQPRFVLTSVALEDSYGNLTEFISSVVVNTFRKCLYLVLAETAPDITLVQVDLTKIELHEGYMVVEGVTK